MENIEGIRKRKKIILLPILAIFLALVFFYPQSSAQEYMTYYVDGQNGDDGNDGLSPGAAFKTVSRGISALKGHSYDTPRELVVLEGEYYSTQEYFNIHNKYENKVDLNNLMGTPEYPVIVRGEGDVTIYGYLDENYDPNTNPGDRIGNLVSGNDMRYLTLENLKFEGAETEVLKLEGHKPDDGSPYPPTGEYGVFGVTITDCEFRYGGHYVGFFVGYNMHDMAIINSKFIGNLNPGFGQGSHDIYWNAGTWGGPNSHNILFDGCEFSFAHRWGIQFNAAHVYNIVIRNTAFHHNQFGGIQVINGHNVTIENNIFYNNNRQDIVIWHEEENWEHTTGEDNTCWNINVSNNIFEGSEILFWNEWSWSDCPSTTQCDAYNNQADCETQGAQYGCEWYSAISGCPEGTTPYCYWGQPRWFNPPNYKPGDYPRLKITIDPPLIGIIDDFYDITVENNIFSNYDEPSLEWVRSDPLCQGCDNKIRNNLFYTHETGKDIYITLDTDGTITDYSISDAEALFPGLVHENQIGDPLYFSIDNGETVTGRQPGASIYDPTISPDSYHDYLAIFPPYSEDPGNNFHYNDGTPAQDIASDNYPLDDFDLNYRPFGNSADAGAYEYGWDEDITITTSYYNGITNILQKDPKYMTNILLEQVGFGIMNFPGPVSMTKSVNLDDYSHIRYNEIWIDTDYLFEFKKPAQLGFYGLLGKFEDPQILKNGEPCTSCGELQLANNIYHFTVEMFSNYSLAEMSCIDLDEDSYNSSSASQCGGEENQDCQDDNSLDPGFCTGLLPEDCSFGFSNCSVCINPGAEEYCDGGFDNNCDEISDEDWCDCITGTPDFCPNQIGVCEGSSVNCNSSGMWPECDAAHYLLHNSSYEEDEISCDGMDNDCDGTIDEGCSCTPGEIQSCGPPTNVGICEFGNQTCLENWIWSPDCVGAVYPEDEICGNGLDDDCDGEIDEGCESAGGNGGNGGGDSGGGGGGAPPECTSGETQDCGTDIGECSFGTQECVNGKWADCLGGKGPSAEVCDGKDNDCDGKADEELDCNCLIGETKPCGSNIGICEEGLRGCVDGDWGDCEGGVDSAQFEICGNLLDDNCNNEVDEGCENLEATCTNKVQDENEEGVDCGGICPDNCPDDWFWRISIVVGLIALLLGFLMLLKRY